MIIILLVLIAVAIYVDRVIIPTVPPPFVPTSTATRSPESFVADAENYAREGKYSLAIGSYRDAIKVDQRNAGLYLAVSRLEIYSAQYEAAEEDAGYALLVNQNSSQAYALQAWARGYQGKYAEALADIENAISLDPTIPQNYAIKAIIKSLQVFEGKEDLNTLQEAIEVSRKAMEMAPSALETRWARGLVLELVSSYDEAIVELKAAINLDPNIAELHLALGRNYRSQALYTEAIEEFSRADALNPTDPNPDTYISAVYTTIGEYAKAIQYAEQAVQNRPADPYLWGNLGRRYYSNYQYENAILAFSFAIHGGITKDGIEVKGLDLDYDRPGIYYYTYGLSLAYLGYCDKALPIAQAVSSQLRADEFAVYNAQEIVRICEAFAEEGRATPTWLATPTNTQIPTATPTIVAAGTPTP